MSSTPRLNCPWIHPAIAKLVADRDAYDRAARGTIRAEDIEAEIAEVTRRMTERNKP